MCNLSADEMIVVNIITICNYNYIKLTSLLITAHNLASYYTYVNTKGVGDSMISETRA